MPIICSHDMIAMISSSMLHLRTTSLHDMISMIACLLASPMIHTCLLHVVDDNHLHAWPHDIFACAQFMCLYAMSQSFVTPYALHDDHTCMVNHLLNASFCTSANHIHFSKCLLSLIPFEGITTRCDIGECPLLASR